MRGAKRKHRQQQPNLSPCISDTAEIHVTSPGTTAWFKGRCARVQTQPLAKRQACVCLGTDARPRRQSCPTPLRCTHLFIFSRGMRPREAKSIAKIEKGGRKRGGRKPENAGAGGRHGEWEGRESWQVGMRGSVCTLASRGHGLRARDGWFVQASAASSRVLPGAAAALPCATGTAAPPVALAEHGERRRWRGGRGDSAESGQRN